MPAPSVHCNPPPSVHSNLLLWFIPTRCSGLALGALHHRSARQPCDGWVMVGLADPTAPPCAAPPVIPARHAARSYTPKPPCPFSHPHPKRMPPSLPRNTPSHQPASSQTPTTSPSALPPRTQVADALSKRQDPAFRAADEKAREARAVAQSGRWMDSSNMPQRHQNQAEQPDVRAALERLHDPEVQVGAEGVGEWEAVLPSWLCGTGRGAQTCRWVVKGWEAALGAQELGRGWGLGPEFALPSRDWTMSPAQGMAWARPAPIGARNPRSLSDSVPAGL